MLFYMYLCMLPYVTLDSDSCHSLLPPCIIKFKCAQVQCEHHESLSTSFILFSVGWYDTYPTTRPGVESVFSFSFHPMTWTIWRTSTRCSPTTEAHPDDFNTTCTPPSMLFGPSWHQWTCLCPRGWYVLPTQAVFDLVSVVFWVYGFDLPIPSNFFWPSFISPGITTPMLILSASHFPFSF